MKLPRVHVISTGWKHATAGLCRDSVKRQVDVEVSHEYIEASEQSPPRTKMQNLHEAIGRLAPDAVVACLDGDDWLFHKRALARVAQAHAEGMWVTYGSFVNSDGSPGFARPYGEHESYRTGEWRLTHLKTFRAGLFQRIKDEDMRYPSDAAGNVVAQAQATERRWIDRADDPAFMCPIVEQAGRARVQYLRDILYVYNEAGGWHRTASPKELEHQARIMGLVRSRPPYTRIEAL